MTFTPGWETVIYAPISERLHSISFQLHHQFKKTPRSKWKDVLIESGRYYNVSLNVYDIQNKELIISDREIPETVMDRLRSVAESPPVPVFHRKLTKHPKQFSVFHHTVIEAPPPKLNYHEGPLSEPLPQETVLHHSQDKSPKFLFLAGGPHHLPPPFFAIHTKNPSRYWLGVFIPLGEKRMRPGILLAESDNL